MRRLFSVGLTAVSVAIITVGFTRESTFELLFGICVLGLAISLAENRHGH